MWGTLVLDPDQLSARAIAVLAEELAGSPPQGVSQEQVKHFFRRRSVGLVESLASLLREITASGGEILSQEPEAKKQRKQSRGHWLNDPRCSICRKPRGTNDLCDKCRNTRRMIHERDHPTTEQQRQWAMELAAFQAVLVAEAEAEQRRIAGYAGRQIVVALVGCGKAKLPHKARAKDLYTGNLFRAARAYAEKCADEWLILSALHGVLDPETEIAPYEKSLDELRDRELAHWQETNGHWLVQHYRGIDVVFVGLAARDYLGGLGRLNLEEPLDGLGIGDRLRWLKAATAACGPRS